MTPAQDLADALVVDAVAIEFITQKDYITLISGGDAPGRRVTDHRLRPCIQLVYNCSRGYPALIRIEALDIDDAVLEKIEVKHHVLWYEVEEACFSDRRHVRRGREGLYEVWSRTDEGRYLLIVIAPKGNGVYVVVTARPMDNSERRSYRKAKGMR